jgi:anti-sigma factor RsiW
MMSSSANDPSAIDCRTAAKSLYDFIDGRLPKAELGHVRAHIEMCTKCAPHFIFARQVLALLPVALPLAGDTSALRARVLAAIAEDGLLRPRGAE